MVQGKHVLSDVYRKDGRVFGLVKGTGKTQLMRQVGVPGTMGASSELLRGKQVERFLHGAEKGFFNTKDTGKFIKRGFWRGPGGMAAAIVAPLLLEKMAAPVVGMAGKWLDESFHDFHQAKRVNYDNRYFNTQQWQMNSYQQMGAAMNNYENSMMSIARIYHSR